MRDFFVVPSTVSIVCACDVNILYLQNKDSGKETSVCA